MGFLTVNRPKKYRVRKRRKLETIQYGGRMKKSGSSHVNLELLPLELIYMIYVESGNLMLPFVCRSLYNKILPLSLSMQRRLVLEQLNVDSELPLYVGLWPFVTAEKLLGWGIKRSVKDYLPYDLENDNSPRALALKAFFVSCGAQLESPAKAYPHFIHNGYLDAVSCMAKRLLRCDHNALIAALDSDLVELASELVKLMDTRCSDLQAVWKAAEKCTVNTNELQECLSKLFFTG